jgi:hypothetical protein
VNLLAVRYRRHRSSAWQEGGAQPDQDEDGDEEEVGDEVRLLRLPSPPLSLNRRGQDDEDVFKVRKPKRAVCMRIYPCAGRVYLTGAFTEGRHRPLPVDCHGDREGCQAWD